MSDPLNEFESRASVAMHDLVPARPDTLSLFDDVARRVADRRRMRTRLAAVGACVAVLTTVGIVSWSTHGSASVPSASGSATTTASARAEVPAPTCPKTAPDLTAWLATNAPSSVLVPGKPVVATACRYYGFNIPHPAGALAGSVVVRADVATWTEVFNSGKPIPEGVSNCPNDSGAAYLVMFGYPRGHPERVLVSPTGCSAATNGTVASQPAGLSLLEGALGKDERSTRPTLVIPTWTGSTGPTALIQGTLSGQVKSRRLCIFLKTPGQPAVPVVWPDQVRARSDRSGWTVVDGAGKTIGAPNMKVSFTGGWVSVNVAKLALIQAGCPATNQAIVYTAP